MKPSLQRLSVLFWLNKQRSRDGKAGIYLRITLDGKRTELFTQHYAHERAWDSRQQMVSPNASDAVGKMGQRIGRIIWIVQARLDSD